MELPGEPGDIRAAAGAAPRCLRWEPPPRDGRGSPSRRDERGSPHKEGFSGGDSRDRHGAAVIGVGARRWQRRVPRRCGSLRGGPGDSDLPSLSGCWRLRLPCRESPVVTGAMLLRVFGWGGAAAGRGLGWTRRVVVWGCWGWLGLIHIPVVHQEQGGGSGAAPRVPRAVRVGGDTVGTGLSPPPPRLPRTHLCCCHSLWGLVAAFPSTNPGICSGFGHGPPTGTRKSHLGVGDAQPQGVGTAPAWGCSARGAGDGRACREGRWL